MTGDTTDAHMTYVTSGCGVVVYMIVDDTANYTTSNTDCTFSCPEPAPPEEFYPPPVPDLGYLYRPKVRLRLRSLRKPRVIFQPCWSSRRWKSLT